MNLPAIPIALGVAFGLNLLAGLVAIFLRSETNNFAYGFIHENLSREGLKQIAVPKAYEYHWILILLGGLFFIYPLMKQHSQVHSLYCIELSTREAQQIAQIYRSKQPNQ